eukprot:m.170995 g.170995  ORF g.170995 m.170995 type:complete len:92 (+) comp31629_c1_seq3:906-1181(+)
MQWTSPSTSPTPTPTKASSHSNTKRLVWSRDTRWRSHRHCHLTAPHTRTECVFRCYGLNLTKLNANKGKGYTLQVLVTALDNNGMIGSTLL